MQKVEIIKFLMALMCELEKVEIVCKLYFMLMHVFVESVLIWLVGLGFNGPLRQYFSLYRAVSQRQGISVEWRNLTMNILAYQSVHCTEFR